MNECHGKILSVRTDLTSLDWNLLRTFYVIVEAKNLTRAAAQLQISQPSVSAALQRLEKSLGCRLVVRASRRFELTRYGVSVVI
ncbi:LysR family transcriptional regulator [Salinihabitans flavidus]|uniref:LysR family transcriptional regulator n=1 Tax=Salinihabitans flavidus TaxID=569882 RepID=UPI000B84AA6D|nr:LysR family transcriptional regulator [Salinihabitans flavidus]